LIVGEIRKPHGIKGECYVKPATDDVAGVYATGREFRVGDSQGQVEGYEQRLIVQAARAFKGGLIIRFEGVEDRNAAEPLRGRTLLLGVDDVRPLDANEYFLHDLSGLEVKTTAGEVIGRVVDVYEAGPSYFLGVDDGERERLIPFTGQIVREVDMKAGTIVIEPIPGLLDV